MVTLGISCAGCAFAFEEDALSNTAFLTAHDVKKVVIGKSFSNCKSTKVAQRYIGLKACDKANLSDFYYLATSFFHHSATQLLSARVMRFVNRAGIKASIEYKEQRTSFGLNANF